MVSREDRRIRIVPWRRPQRLYLYAFVAIAALDLIVTIAALTRI